MTNHLKHYHCSIRFLEFSMSYLVQDDYIWPSILRYVCFCGWHKYVQIPRWSLEYVCIPEHIYLPTYILTFGIEVSYCVSRVTGKFILPFARTPVPQYAVGCLFVPLHVCLVVCFFVCPLFVWFCWSCLVWTGLVWSGQSLVPSVRSSVGLSVCLFAGLLVCRPVSVCRCLSVCTCCGFRSRR